MCVPRLDPPLEHLISMSTDKQPLQGRLLLATTVVSAESVPVVSVVLLAPCETWSRPRQSTGSLPRNQNVSTTNENRKLVERRINRFDQNTW